MVAAGRLYAVSGERGGEGGTDVGEKGREGGMEGGLFVLPSASTQCRRSSGTEKGGEVQGLPAQLKRGRVFPRSVCKSTGSQSSGVTWPHQRSWGPAQRRSSRVSRAVSAQRWCHDLFWGSDVRPLQWGERCFISWMALNTVLLHPAAVQPLYPHNGILAYSCFVYCTAALAGL